MASIEELKKRAYEMKNSEKKEDDEISSRIQRMKEMAQSTTLLNSDDVDEWYSAASSVGQRAYSYLTKEGYKRTNTSYLSEIDAYLSKAHDVERYIKVNKDSFADYDSVAKSHYDMVNYLRSLKNGINSSNSFYSNFKDEEDYNFWDTHSTPEKRQAWYKGLQDTVTDLGSVYDNYYTIGLLYQDYQANPSAYTPEEAKDIVSKYQKHTEYKQKYGSEKGIMDAIKAAEIEMRNYERGNVNENGRFYGSKDADAHYAVTQRPDFAITSAKRDYTNPTREQLGDYDSSRVNAEEKINSYDGEHYYDAAGNIIEYDDDPGVQDKLGMFLSTASGEVTEAYNILSSPSGERDTWAKMIQEGDQGSWKYLEPDEIGIYYTYLGESQEKAYQYLEDMTTELNRRQTLDEIGQWDKAYDEANFLEKIAMNAATIPAKFVSNVAGTIENTANTLMGNEINPYSAAHSGMHYSQVVRGNTAEDLDEWSGGWNFPVLDKVGVDISLGDLYQVGMSQIDSRLATSVFGSGGTLFLGMGAAQEEAYRLYQQGASAKQITLGAATAGAAEWFFEKFSFDELVNGMKADTFGQWVKKTLAQGGVEMYEEAATEVSNILTNAVILGKQSDLASLYEENGRDWKKTGIKLVQQVLESGISGFFAGAGTGATAGGKSYAVSKVNEIAQNAETGNIIRGAEGGVKALGDLTMKVAGETDGKLSHSLKKQAGKVSGEVATGKGIGKIGAAVKNFSRDVQAGRLYNDVTTANKVANTSANQADIVKSLQRKGFAEGEANDIAAAIVAQYNGKSLTKAQEKLLKSVMESSVVRDAISNIVNNPQSTMGQRQQNIRDFQEDVRVGVISRSFGVSTEDAKEIVNAMFGGDTIAQAEAVNEDSAEVSMEGKSFVKSTGEEARTVTVEKISGKGDVSLTVNGKGGVPMSDVSFKDEVTNFAFNAVTEAAGMTPEAANVILSRPKATNSKFIAEALRAFQIGVRNDKLALSRLDGDVLTKTEADILFEEGRKAAEAKAKAAEDAVYNVYQKAKGVLAKTGKKATGKLRIAEGVDVDGFNDQQTFSAMAAAEIAPSLSVDVVLYEDENPLKFGYYKHSEDAIYLNVNARWSGNSMMTFTLAHELVHRAKTGSPRKFKAFADFLVSEYGKAGVSAEDLIAEQLSAAKAANVKLTEDEAFEEVICDAAQRMLTDTDAGKKLAQWGQQSKENADFLQKLKQWLTELFDNLRAYFKNAESDSKAANAFRKLDKNVQRILADMFVDMSTDAAEKLSTIKAAGMLDKINTTGEGGVRHKFKGYAEDGKGIYESNFPKGTPKKAKGERILKYIQDVWSKKPITLRIEENGKVRYIEAMFDPTYDAEHGQPSDATKLMGGNRHGNAIEQRVTLDLADDYYKIANESRYNGSKQETGKELITHIGVKQWHYFVNDIYFAEYESDELVPYTVSINVKEKQDGNFFYSFSAEKTEGTSTPRTLHAAVSSGNDATTNGNSSNDSIRNPEEKVKQISTTDSDYMGAVNRGDMETAQRMVDEAAKAAGYSIKAYHGTTNQEEHSTWNAERREWDTTYSPITVFKRQYDEQVGHFFSADRDNAGGYGSYLYSVFLMIKKPLVIDCNGQFYNSISFDGKTMDTYEWAEYAHKHRYDGVIFKNVRDGVDYGAISEPVTEYVVFDSNRIKSADPITYDKEGNVIPLSERFNPTKRDIRYKVSARNAENDFDYSQLNWARDAGIITDSDAAIFERTINNEIYRGAKPQTADGEYIIDTGRCLMFTDGDFHNPTLSRVIVFATEYESLTADAKEMIRDDAATTGDLQKSLTSIKNMFRPGFIVEHTPAIYGANGWQNRGRKGTTGSGSHQGYRAKSLRERLAEEGLIHLLDDDASDNKIAVREDTSAPAILKKVDASTATPMQQEKLAAYREQLKKIDTQKEILRSQNERLKDAKGHAKAMLQSNIRKTKNRIQILEDQLARMENHKALQTLVEKERAAAEVRYQESIDQILQEMRERYGMIPKGEKAVRDDALPVSTDGKNKVSHTARTVKGAAVTPDEFAGLIEAEVAKGELTYLPISNDGTAKEAEAWVKKVGWTAALAEWYRDVGAGKTGADIVARGAVLLNNAAQTGDRDTWREILFNYQLLGTHTAQGLQALRILKKLSPSDSVYMIKRSVEQMVNDLHPKTDIVLDKDLLKRYETAENDEQRDIILGMIQQSVADQLPASFIEKFTALRYVNMLGNLRTQVRNFFGNVSMMATSAVKNTIAASLESLVYYAGGRKLERTRSLFVDKKLILQAKADYKNVEALLLDGGRYSAETVESSEFAKQVKEKRTIFKNKLLEKYRNVTNTLTEQGDLLFSKAAYARALAGYLQAKGSADMASVDPGLLDEARLFAVQQAQEQTFRDTNWLSGWVSKIGRRRDTPAIGRVVGEGVMPFRKTPANIMVRAEEYSPLGLFNSLYISAQAMRKDSNVTGAQVINSWAKTLTGTGLFALGMWLSAIGGLTGGRDDDEDMESFERMYGIQNYAIVFPDGTNLTFDWVSPAAIPLLMGAQLMELCQEDGFQLKDLESAFTSIIEPFVEMSMLQGVKDALDNVQYAENNLGQMVITFGLNYLTQGITNSSLGQIERTFQDVRETTYVDKDSAIPGWLQRSIGTVFSKVPGLDYNQISYINAWGEEEQNPNVLLNAIYNMISPSYVDHFEKDDVYNELMRLDKAQGDKKVLPSVPDKTYDGRQLIGEEYVLLAKTQGQMQRKLVEELIRSDAYKGMTDVDKATAVSLVYQYAKEKSQIDVLGRNSFSAKWLNEIGDSDPVKAIVAHTGEQSAKNAYSGIKERFIAGDLSTKDLAKELVTHGKEKEEIFWITKEWAYEKANGTADGYSKYNDFYVAAESGKNLKTVISEYTSYGVTKDTLAGQITSHFKPLYKNMSKSERASIKGYLLNAYEQLGYDRSKKSKDIDKWLND